MSKIYLFLTVFVCFTFFYQTSASIAQNSQPTLSFEAGFSTILTQETSKNTFLKLDGYILKNYGSLEFSHEFFRSQLNSIVVSSYDSLIQLNYTIQDKWSMLICSKFRSFPSAGTDHEQMVGIGAGFNINPIQISTGLFLRDQNQDLSTISRSNLKFVIPLLFNLSFLENLSLNASLHKGEDYDISSDSSVLLSLSTLTSLKFGVKYLFDNDPEQNFKKESKRIYSSICFSF